MAKVLMIDYEKCTGCRICEQVCSVKHEGVSNPARSRIKIVKWESEGRYVPVGCQQCESAPCMAICPVQALFRDEELPLLAPLPATHYELAEWKQATVQFNYHISIEGMLYSIPYEYVYPGLPVYPLKY